MRTDISGKKKLGQIVNFMEVPKSNQNCRITIGEAALVVASKNTENHLILILSKILNEEVGRWLGCVGG